MNIKLLKLLKNKQTLIFLIVIFFALLARFYNFSSRVTFWSEQAQTLITSSDYLTKPSLLGQEFFRHDSSGHVIYAGALFNYTLVPLILISKWDPIFITAFFTFINVLTGVVIYFAVKKIFNQNIALLSMTIFLFNDLMFYHSLFIWIYNYLPMIGILVFYVAWLNLHRRSPKYVFLQGVLCGIGVGLQVLFIVWAGIVLFVNLWRSKKRLIDFVIFAVGAAVGELPAVIFDLRHNFYQVTTVWNYFLETLKGTSDATFNYYYFLALWPILAIVVGWIVLKLFKKSKVLGLIVLTLYIFLNLTSGKVNFNAPTGMPGGLRVEDVSKASQKIAQDASGEFNVAEVLDFDKRAYVLRYFLVYKYSKRPLGIEEYPSSKFLYVLAPDNFDFSSTNIWEINSGGPHNTIKLTNVGTGYQIAKLQYCPRCK